jgi:meiotic recombination protein SPO11
MPSSAVVLRILELVHDALVNNVVITKRYTNRRPSLPGEVCLILTTSRDIYYRDPALFSKQAVVDRFVDDLACTFGVRRLLLNVVSCLTRLFWLPLLI